MMGNSTTDSEQKYTANDMLKAYQAGYDRRQYHHDENYGGVEYWKEEPKPFKYWIKEYEANDSEQEKTANRG